MPHLTEERRLQGRSDLTTIGLEKPLVPGRERVCPDCRLVYWLAAGHPDCATPEEKGIAFLQLKTFVQNTTTLREDTA